MRDAEVVASIVAGDPDGLAAAYDRYADPLFKYCRTLLNDPADAADAVQDTFVIADSRLDGLREPERFRPWLYTVARNECLRVLRAKKGTPALTAKISERWGAEIAACVASEKVTTQLNQQLHFAANNHIPVSTPQMFLGDKRICDEDTDLGLKYTLAQLAPELLP